MAEVDDSPPFPDAPTTELRWLTTPALYRDALEAGQREDALRIELAGCARRRAALFAELASRHVQEARHG